VGICGYIEGNRFLYKSVYRSWGGDNEGISEIYISEYSFPLTFFTLRPLILRRRNGNELK
jgi:hypothetical protein